MYDTVLQKGPCLSRSPDPALRILDANINRLREALRVIEEYYRFIDEQPQLCAELKVMRHSIAAMEAEIGRQDLLRNRDTSSDCFAGENRPEELDRGDHKDVVIASFKRAQEAGRVIEEYAKASGHLQTSQTAKTARFGLYELEKRFLNDGLADG